LARLESDLAHIKSEVADLKVDVRGLREEMRGEFSDIRKALAKEFAELPKELAANSKAIIRGDLMNRIWTLLVCTAMLGVIARGALAMTAVRAEEAIEPRVARLEPHTGYALTNAGDLQLDIRKMRSDIRGLRAQMRANASYPIQ
jgi:phage shock protein A